MSEPEMACSRLTVWALCAIGLQITGLSLFVLGFFPIKPTLSGFSGPDSYVSPQSDSSDAYNGTAIGPEKLRSLYQELSQLPPSYDRMILVVIDGLPAEFVLGKDGQPPPKGLMNAMPYTQSLLVNGDAVGYHAKAAPPTVTMPRLKAMVSGAIGGFLDVVFNFNTQAYLDDNLLAQFFKIDWKMVMLGDETWLKLFPQYFVRQDGVSSFFVKDTVQVDLNISRHLPHELEQDDWQLLILHYLGVDHVGHIGGRRSALMAPKLKEMDDVIKLIHQNNIQQNGKDKEQTLLVVASDHGMTDNGNHGGSSYEETDALLLFVGLTRYSGRTLASGNTVKQVDISPTLALLFGVPIPANNVGSLIAGSLDHLTDEKYLRALELNSWQLLRLLGAEMPYLSCLKSAAPAHGDYLSSTISICEELEALEVKLCCLYSMATAQHSFWESKNSSRSYADDYRKATTAYFDFLEAASEWLSHRVTDKPIGLLLVGILAIFLSTLEFLRILYYLRQEEKLKQILGSTDQNRSSYSWSADEIYILSAIMLLVISMGSSSMVEEEQYTWHFLTMTLYLILLHKRIKSIAFGVQSSPGNKRFNYSCIISISLLLLSMRIMRGWHQGGVNWTYYPDISKWLEQSGSTWIKAFQLLAGLLVLSSGLLALNKSKLNKMFLFLVKSLFLGLLVLQHLGQSLDVSLLTSSRSATVMAQSIYVVLGILAFFTVVISPWITSVKCYDTVNRKTIYLEELRASLYLSGLVCTLCWSLLQLLLQQAVNSMPVFLLLIQILATTTYFGKTKLFLMQWVEVTTLFFLGMTGHFGLGNTNTLATIDVAGAFIGISSHSTFLSGVLMFCITYASPMMVLLSLVIYISVKDENSSEAVDFSSALKIIFSPCLVLLGLNSVLLTAYTLVLLQMRNHLFIWSVFSPKYMYVCATTACIYIGLLMVAVIEGYTFLVFASRKRL